MISTNTPTLPASKEAETAAWRWRLPSDDLWQFVGGPEKPRLGLPKSTEASVIFEPLYAHPTPTTTGVSEAEMREAGLFLIDRLAEFEHELDAPEVENEFYGHVSPAIASLRAALTAPAGDGVPGIVPRKPLTSHARTSPGPINCNLRLQMQGHEIEPACERCNGSCARDCPFFFVDGQARDVPLSASTAGGGK